MIERGNGSLTLRHELGGYREYDPPAHLARFAEAVWVYRAPADLEPSAAAMHRVLPDPSVDLAFCCRRSPDGRAIEPRLGLIGPKTGPHLFAYEPGCEIASIKIKLEWTRPLLDSAPLDHRDTMNDLSLVLPRLADSLFQALTETRTAHQALTTLGAALVVRTRAQSARDPVIASRALDLVRRTSGRLPIAQVVDEVGASERHLRRIVTRDADVSLKGYARTVRFLNAVTTADRSAGDRPAWARVAAESGFADQSHLVRDFQALCGLSPGEVFRERRAEQIQAARRVAGEPAERPLPGSAHASRELWPNYSIAGI